MDTEELLERISSLSIDWSCSPARIREKLMSSGCTGISEKRIKHLKSEHLRQKSGNEVKSCASMKKVRDEYENEDKAAMELQKLHEKGKLKGRNFEKALPNVASALCSGELKSEHAANVLTSRFLASKNQPQIIPDTNIEAHELMLTHLAKETFTLGHSRKYSGDKCYEFVCDLQSRFNILMESSCRKLPQRERFSSDGLSAIGASMFSALQQAYDETCSIWETKLDRHYKKGEGYFRRICSLYRCEETEFISWLMSKVSTHITPDMVSEGLKTVEEVSEYHKSVTQAAQEVERGDICWQCNTQHSLSTIKRCSQCKCAIYCSVKCQKADWKKHKVVCTALGDQRRAVDSTFPRQTVPVLKVGGDKGKRNPDVEAMVKYWLTVRPGGSLENFYMQLDRVIANEWWLDPQHSDTEELPSTLDRSSITEFLLLCFYMARGGDNLSLKEFQKGWFPSTEALMTRSSFLFTYKCFSMGENEASRNRMHSMMRKQFRKAAQTIQSWSENSEDVD